MGSIQQDLLTFKRMHLLMSLVLVLPALVVCDFRHDVLVRSNELRDSIGIGPLSRDADLEENAQMWANYLTRDTTCQFFHQSPLPSDVRAENIAISLGQAMTGEIAVNNWWNSPTGHRNTMRNEDYSRIGVGIASGCRMQGFDAWEAWI